MPKRPPGVYKRGGTWAVVIDHGRDPKTGRRKRVWHSGFATLSEAVEARTRLLRERDTGAAIDPSRQTLAEFVRDEWLPSRAPTTGTAGRGHRGKVNVQTWYSYRQDLECHVLPTLGAKPLQQLTPSDINRLYDELEQSGGRNGAGLSPKTVANVHGVLHKALADAVKLGKVPRNVSDAVEKPSAGKASHDIWSPEQLRAFLQHVGGDRYYAMWLLFATTGMRRGEVAGLAWDDVDLTGGYVRVSWTLGSIQGKPTWKSRAKSPAGQRLMALDPTTVQGLREHRRRQNEERLMAGSGWQRRQTDWRGEHRDDVVFTWPDGRFIQPERLSKWFAVHCQEAGLPRIRLHDVRHTYASAALANATGWHEMKLISQRLGHANIGITLDTYAHVLPAADEQAARTLARVILGDDAGATPT